MARGTEIAARVNFEDIRYAQVWEDADVLVEALRPGPGDTVVSIASAGDNVLALLAEAPERVIAVDLNPAQLACLRLRMAAYRRLRHSELLELMGSRASARRGELLDRTASTLDDVSQTFWAPRKDAVALHGLAGIGRFERYFQLFRSRVLPLAHSPRTVQALLEPKPAEERAAFYDRSWNNVRWRLLVKTFFSRPVMGSFGRDPAFFDQVRGSVAEHVARKTRQALVDQDPSQNPYLAWILTGSHGGSLPRALRAEAFEPIRERLEVVHVEQCAFEALAAQGVRADAFNLSDVFEYMSAPAHAAAYEAVLAMGRSGARVAYWNMMAPRRAPEAARGRVRARDDLASPLKAVDKAFFYSDFVLEEVA